MTPTDVFWVIVAFYAAIGITFGYLKVPGWARRRWALSKHRRSVRRLSRWAERLPVGCDCARCMVWRARDAQQAPRGSSS